MPSVVTVFEYAIYGVAMLLITVFVLGGAIINLFRKNK